MDRRRGISAALVTAVAALAAAAPAPAAGLVVTSEKQLTPRLSELTVRTSALPAPAHIRVLLPDGYAAQPRRRWPVLYLLHGTSGGAADWTTMGDAERTTAGLPLIVVMPDIALGKDGGGWCTDWVNGGRHGPPEWERFHIGELIPFVDARLRTRARREGRAIAGLSQGGFCAMSYAARHPDRFVSATSFSGPPDIAYSPVGVVGVTAIVNATEVFLDGAQANAMFGDRLTNGINWAAHDPATLAENLRGMQLQLFTGNGLPGPLDANPINPGASLIEAAAGADTRLFHDRLESLGIPSRYEPYGAGTHIWPYWARDLRQAIGPIVRTFADPPPAPRSVRFTAAEPRYDVFSWRVAITRRATEMSALADASARGFTLTGSGTATVRTPPLLRPRRRYAVTLRGDLVGPGTTVRRADRQGRLTVDVPLGPANPHQQGTPAAALSGTRAYTTRVTIRPARIADRSARRPASRR
jgi:S-formylglutathione hydrolase FrmB